MTLEVNGSAVARWASILVPARQLAEVIASTDFVPKAMREQPDVVTAAIMYGDEIGVGPMQALVGIHVVEGRPAPSAELMRALILRAGHNITIHDTSGTRCRVSGLRAGRPESERFVVDWTLDMARAAGLLGRQTWQRYPRAMLLARATSDLARAIFPDVVKGLGYIAEDEETASELAGWVPEEDAPRPVERRPVQRRTKPQPRPLETVELPDFPEPPQEPTSGPDDAITQPEPAEQPEAAPEPPGEQIEPLVATPDPIEQPVAGRHAATAPASESEPLPPDDDAEAAMPDLQPEAPPDEPAAPGAGPVPVSDGIRRGLLISWRKIAEPFASANAELDRMRRLEAWSHIIGREIDSSRDLTRANGWTLAQALGRVEDGDAVLVESEEGWLRIRDWPDHQPARQPDGQEPLL